MNVFINVLRLADAIEETLQGDGWAVAAVDGTEMLVATHPRVRNEGAARSRLFRLGMLTSGSLRIEFRPRRKAK
jgi:hypothetical protein